MTEQSHIPPDPGAKLHDRRGALVLATPGLVGHTETLRPSSYS